MTDSVVKYTAGWARYTPAEVDAFGIDEPYRSELAAVLSIWNPNHPLLFDTPGEAQGLIDQICAVNSLANIKLVNKVGPEGFFIVECVRPVGRRPFWRKWRNPHNAHIIPVPYTGRRP
jgi:hypothetical protein